MKKTNISKFVAVGLCICALTGCGASPDEKPDTSNPTTESIISHWYFKIII